jgi:drug/metabolite transporter (DMT)-like permease
MHIFLYSLAIFSLSQSAHWVRWSGAPVTQLGFWRLLLAALIWLPFVKKNEVKTFFKAENQRLILWAVSAGVLLFLHLWTFQFAAQHTRIANQMILFSSNPLWTAALTLFLFREKLSWSTGLAYALSVSGILMLVFHQLKFDQQTLTGDGVALLSALLYSAYFISSREARHKLSNPLFSSLLFAVAAIGFAIANSVLGIDLLPSFSADKTWIAILGLTLVSTMLGHSLFVYLVKYLNINWMSCGKLAEPLLASITAYFLFQETIPALALGAFALTASGVFVLIWNRR